MIHSRKNYPLHLPAPAPLTRYPLPVPIRLSLVCTAKDFKRFSITLKMKTKFFEILNLNDFNAKVVPGMLYLTISRRRRGVTSLYSMSLRRSEYRLVITEPEVTNCFSINFQVFTKRKSTQLYNNSLQKNICKNSLCIFSL